MYGPVNVEIGQNILQSFFQKGSDNRPSYFQIFLRHSWRRHLLENNSYTMH